MDKEILDIFKLQINKQKRAKNYDFIENFIKNNVKDWDVAPDTDRIEKEFTKKLKSINDNEFAFLLLHSGYIPEFYEHDSSQETLYSKLIESLVCEWAVRIGFTDSYLQKQKANKEDITIKTGTNTIVSDAKSFRLGRSQSAPNVKDTIKQASYITWLSAYKGNTSNAGLISFPSLMNWKRNSEAYKYFTDSNLPILFLFYEHLAFILISDDLNFQNILDYINNYDKIFIQPSKDKANYFNKLNANLFKTPIKERLDNFLTLSKKINKERIEHTLDRIEKESILVQNSIKKHIDTLSPENVKKMAVDMTYQNHFGQLLKQKDNIKKFRL